MEETLMESRKQMTAAVERASLGSFPLSMQPQRDGGSIGHPSIYPLSHTPILPSIFSLTLFIHHSTQSSNYLAIHPQICNHFLLPL